MNNGQIEGWSIQEETDQKVLLTAHSGKATVSCIRVSEAPVETWYIDGEIDNGETDPKSAKLTVSDNEELWNSIQTFIERHFE